MASLAVVDDEIMVRELYAAWLRDAGHTVYTAGSVPEAQHLLREYPVDVLFSDISMTQETGIDLLAWMCEHAPDRSFSSLARLLWKLPWRHCAWAPTSTC